MPVLEPRKPINSKKTEKSQPAVQRNYEAESFTLKPDDHHLLDKVISETKDEIFKDILRGFKEEPFKNQSIIEYPIQTSNIPVLDRPKKDFASWPSNTYSNRPIINTQFTAFSSSSEKKEDNRSRKVWSLIVFIILALMLIKYILQC